MRITLLLAAAFIIVFLATRIAVPDVGALHDHYGFSAENMAAQPYVAITALFLHADLEHLLSNLLVLLFFGIAVEKEMGSLRTFGIFLLGGLGGDVVSLVAYSPATVSIGASAGIFALIGVGMLVKPLDLSFYPLIMPVPLLFLGVGYALYNAYGLFFMHESNVSFIGHFGGLAVGLVVGCAVTGFQKGLRTLVIGLACVAAIIGAWFVFLR